MTAEGEPVDEVLAVSSATKVYLDGDRRIEALASATLTVPRGVLWVLRGPSGSGKTTLLGVLGGLTTPTSGEVRVLGERIVTMRDHHRTRLRRRAVGFVLQELGLVPRMTVLENVLLPLTPLGGATRDDVARARANLEKFGIGSRADTRVERLSGGERQRVAVTRALCTRPPCLLLDEPTAHLDGASARDVVDLLVRLRDEEQCTIVAATHDARLSEDPRVDRVLDMADGRLTIEQSESSS